VNIHADPSKASCFEGYKVIDVDTHLSEPHDMWVKRAPSKFKDRVPQIKVLNGQRCWVIDGDKSIGRGASPNSAILKDGTKPPGFAFMQYQMEDVHPGSSRVKERLEFMDGYGISAQVIYPNLLGFGGQRAANVDAELRLLSMQLYNDAMADFQAESGNRLFPMALLPWWDIEASVKEAIRTSDMGLRGININPDPHTKTDNNGNRLPALGHPAWDPLWEVCTDRNLPVNFHIGGSEQSIDWFGDQAWPSFNDEHKGLLGGAMLFFCNALVMANLIMSGVCDRHPKLKFVSVESGIGWVPFLLEALDHQYYEILTTPSLKKKPSEYFASNFYACFWFERRDISKVIQDVGVNNVLFETDYPHPTCLYPIDGVSSAMSALGSENIRKVLSGNAEKVYNITS
jgi:predicted TIM-barrel fold metal-dependent hydrolase